MISVCLFSIIMIVAMAYYSTFRSSYLEQVAQVKCQASARTAENHILTNLRRSRQNLITASPDGKQLTVVLPAPSAGPDITETYSVVPDVTNGTYDLVLLKNASQIVISDNIDGADPDTGGFQALIDHDAKTNVSVVNFTIKTRIQQRGTRTTSYTTSASHKIRTDSN